jgi:hypothetical protein
MTWNEGLPPDNRKVLAYYKNDLNNDRIVIARYYGEKEMELTDYDDLEGEYDDESGVGYWPAGWYEQIENWDDYSSVTIIHEVLAWAPLPKPPGKAEEEL